MFFVSAKRLLPGDSSHFSHPGPKWSAQSSVRREWSFGSAAGCRSPRSAQNLQNPSPGTKWGGTLRMLRDSTDDESAGIDPVNSRRMEERVSPPDSCRYFNYRRYHRIASLHCSSCQAGRSFDLTCSLPKYSHASRPGGSRRRTRKDSNQPITIIKPSRCGTPTAREASRSRLYGHKKDIVKMFI